MFDLTDEHIKIEEFKENLSIETLNKLINGIFFREFLKNDHDEVYNKYIDLFVDKSKIDNTYYMNLENYINYYDENDNITTTDKISKIDFSFYNSNKIKEYLFMIDFLSDFYKSKYKNKQEYDTSSFYNKKININFRSNLESDKITINRLKEYIPLELVLRNEKMGNENNSIIKSIKNTNDDDRRGPSVNNFKILFNKIKFKNVNDLNNNIHYYFGVFLSYKYKYYELLINYYSIMIYLYYIFKNGQNEQSNIVKMQEILSIIEKFHNILLIHEVKFNQLNTIMGSVEKLDEKAESEKIEEAKYSMNKLKKYNYNLLVNQDNIRNSHKKMEVTQNDIKTNIYKIIVISLLLTLTFITYIITINYYSLDTSKLLSIIIICVIVIVILVNNYIIKNKTYEKFELVPEVTEEDSDETTDTLIQILENEEGTLSDVYEKMQELQERQNTITNTQFTDISTGNNLGNLSDSIAEQDIDALTQENTESRQNSAANYKQIQDAYDEYIAAGGSESGALSRSIIQLNNNLNNLNAEYEIIKQREAALIQTKKQMEENLETTKMAVEAAETQLIEKMEKIDKMSILLDDYNAMNLELNEVVLRKEQIKDLKLEKIDEINKLNVELLNTIEQKSKELLAKESDVGDLDNLLNTLIYEIDVLNRQKKDFEDNSVIEDKLIVEIDEDIKIQYARYSKVADRVTKQIARIANLRNMIESQDMAVQKWAKRIIDLENKNRIRAQKAEEMAIKASEEAKKAYEILDKKIKAIEDEIANRPKPINYKIKLNLNYSIAGEVNTPKRYSFKNEILLELSRLLLVPLNRFDISNINEGSIDIYLIFYPSRTYDIRDISHTALVNVLTNIFTQEPADEKLLNTKYLKFAMEVSELDESLNIIPETTKSLSTSQILLIDNIKTKINLVLNKNVTIIQSLETIITQLENEKHVPNTYYNEINPKLNLEVRKYSQKDSQINNNNKVLDSKADILVHDYIGLHYIYKYVSYITLLLSLVFLGYSYLNNYTLIIYVIAVIIFLIILFNLYLDIYKNVRRKSKKQYWTKPKI